MRDTENLQHGNGKKKLQHTDNEKKNLQHGKGGNKTLHVIQVMIYSQT